MTTTRGRNQDRKLVAGGQDYEVGYESQNTSKSRKQVKSAVKRAGNSRRQVERNLSR